MSNQCEVHLDLGYMAKPVVINAGSEEEAVEIYKKKYAHRLEGRVREKSLIHVAVVAYPVKQCNKE